MTPLIDALFAVTDLETTGLSADRNRITEIALVMMRGGEIVQEQRTLVNPGQAIPLEIQRMTGITNAMVHGARPGSEIFPEVRQWFPDESIFTAHNVAFDHGFLQASFRRHDLPILAGRRLCTARLARRLLTGRKGYSLAQVAAHFGIRIRRGHRALDDARAAAQILASLVEIAQEQHHCETIDDLLLLQNRQIGHFREQVPSIARMHERALELPPDPGIYRMIDRRGEILYVGKAKSLRERVASYFRPGAIHTSRIAEMVRRVRSIEVEETGSELAALLRESRLIKELQPRYNTLQKRYRRYAFLRIDPAEAWARPSASYEIEPDGAEYFGPFAGRAAVEGLIETINGAFLLRECSGDITPSERANPCLYHYIGRCGAPCASLQSEEEYRRELDRVRGFLSGADDGVLPLLERRMEEAAEALEFERAAELRDRVEDLRRIFRSQERVADSVNANNVVIVLPSPVAGERELFLIRFGRLVAQVRSGPALRRRELRALLRRHYVDGAVAPPHCRREEIDEIRIIACYLHARREEGESIVVGPDEQIDEVVERILWATGRSGQAVPLD